MNRPETYSLSVRPQYAPSAEAPDHAFGQILVQDSSRHIACTLEFRADWAPDGSLEVSAPDPAGLPGLSADEIKARAERAVALFRQDKMAGAGGAEDNDDEMETLQASDTGVRAEGDAAL